MFPFALSAAVKRESVCAFVAEGDAVGASLRDLDAPMAGDSVGGSFSSVLSRQMQPINAVRAQDRAAVVRRKASTNENEADLKGPFNFRFWR